MKARLATEIGTRVYLRVYWHDTECHAPHGYGYHNAKTLLTQSSIRRDHNLGGEPKDYPDEAWPKVCEHCQLAAPSTAERQIFYDSWYDTPSGSLEEGCLYWVDWYKHHETGACFYWDNCTSPHLHAVVPGGDHWDIDSRARNCTKPEDKLHRCWVRHGTPPNITVDKNGLTCSAGAGSIQTTHWHGFLRNGEFTL